ncbi:MAG: M61 family metallopeptidase [Longimicrobiales bacterium]
MTGIPALLANLLLAALPQAADSVAYDVHFPNVAHHEVEITVRWGNLPARPLETRMSRSSPGRYALHEFARNVYSVSAVDSRGRALDITRADPHSWMVYGHDGTVRLTYTLYADRADGTYSGIDRSHAHLNMPATFMWAPVAADRPIRITFHPPAGSNWRVATQLGPTASPATFTSPHLQYFMDSPTELSDFDVREWTVASGSRQDTIRIALHHQGTDPEFDVYAEMARKVVAEQIAIYGNPAPYDHGLYTFLADYLPWVAGDGMEHRNSTVISNTGSLADNALGLLGTLSHEFFHSWNVERMRPKSLEPFDFSRENMSDLLWFAEGFTSYYDDLAIRRAGIFDDARYAEGLTGTINTVLNAPGRSFFTAAEMSMQAPFVDAAVANDPNNRGNTFISYYTWGAGIGLGLDLTLRSRFNLTLDDYMRAMWTKHGVTERPYTIENLRLVLGEITKDQSFADDFFARYIQGHEAVDYEALLANAGILLRRAAPDRPTLGQALFQVRNNQLILVSASLIDTPLYDAGIDRGDQIIALDAQPVASTEQLDAIVARHKPGDTIAVEFYSRGETRNATITLVEDPRLEVVLYEAAGREVTPAMHAFRRSWLGSKAE